MSSAPFRQPKPPRSSPPERGAAARHRKQSPAGPPRPARWGTPARAVAVAVAGMVGLVCGGAMAVHERVHPPALTRAWLAQAAGELADWTGAWATKPQMVSASIARSASAYRNPLRRAAGLVPMRIDEGVDFNGTGPVYALGDAIITNASGSNAGWPGGGWITYRLTSGPAEGQVVYVAEDIVPAVTAGQHVTAATVIGTMFAGGDGIETGWSQPTVQAPESQLPEAGGIAGLGPFPTRIGLNFEELLRRLGVPAAPNRTQRPYGLLPIGYPVTW
ncbi:MAG: hypothetical protein J2P35_17430, partial [Actinobacteria bacterium]|nr:hypothetical protein [Actinomycetota bacterium]